MSKHFWGYPDTLPSHQQNIEARRKALEQQIASDQAALIALIKPEQRIDDTPPDSPKVVSNPCGFISDIPLLDLGGAAAPEHHD